MPIPVEAFTGAEFAELLSINNITLAEVKNLLAPRLISARPTQLFTIDLPTQSEVTIEQIGSKRVVKVALNGVKKNERRRKNLSVISIVN